MFLNYIFDLSVLYTLARRGGRKACFTAVLLPWLMMSYLPTTTNPNAYIVEEEPAMLHSDFGQLTEAAGNSLLTPAAGYDPCVISSASNPDMSRPTLGPITYAVNGYMVVRRSELGPLTGTTDNSLMTPKTEYDPCAINGASDPTMSQPTLSPITYTVNGFTVVRRSELGPLTGTTDNSLLTHGPGHDYGVLGDEYKLP